MLKIIANITIICINYLQKHGIEILQDKKGNLINISICNELMKAWQNRPIETMQNGKEGLYYKHKFYVLLGDKENE